MFFPKLVSVFKRQNANRNGQNGASALETITVAVTLDQDNVLGLKMEKLLVKVRNAYLPIAITTPTLTTTPTKFY